MLITLHEEFVEDTVTKVHH